VLCARRAQAPATEAQFVRRRWQRYPPLIDPESSRVLTRSVFYSGWVLRWLIAFGLIELGVRAHARYFPSVPWLVVQVPLVVAIILGLLWGPRSYAAYRRAAERRNPAKAT